MRKNNSYFRNNTQEVELSAFPETDFSSTVVSGKGNILGTRAGVMLVKDVGEKCMLPKNLYVSAKLSPTCSSESDVMSKKSILVNYYAVECVWNCMLVSSQTCKKFSSTNFTNIHSNSCLHQYSENIKTFFHQQKFSRNRFVSIPKKDLEGKLSNRHTNYVATCFCKVFDWKLFFLIRNDNKPLNFHIMYGVLLIFQSSYFFAIVSTLILTLFAVHRMSC